MRETEAEGQRNLSLFRSLYLGSQQVQKMQENENQGGYGCG